MCLSCQYVSTLVDREGGGKGLRMKYLLQLCNTEEKGLGDYVMCSDVHVDTQTVCET